MTRYFMRDTPLCQMEPVSYTHLRAHETRHDLVCRLLLEKKKSKTTDPIKDARLSTHETHFCS